MGTAPHGGENMVYTIICVAGHYEVYDASGGFVLSADTRREALDELRRITYATAG